MPKTFEDEFMEAQADMVSICFTIQTRWQEVMRKISVDWEIVPSIHLSAHNGNIE